MPQPPRNSSGPPGSNRDGTPDSTDPEQWLNLLNRSDQSAAQMLAIEVWAIAKTMDELMPGFWGRFMANRQIALKQFLQHKRKQSKTPKAPDHSGAIE